MSASPFNVLFVCTGNSARSVIAEAILNRLGAGRFVAHSAGSHPTGRVNPHALRLLGNLGYPTDELRSKDWAEFAEDGAPDMSFVFTVCDQAAGEVCPVWPGRPITAHWGLPDPAAVAGTEAEIDAAFADTYRKMRSRIETFVNLPMTALDRLAIENRVDEIGQDLSESA